MNLVFSTPLIDNTKRKLGYCKLFGPRPDSQDVWILHSNWVPHKKIRNKHFKITLGMPGCDNIAWVFHDKVIVYLMTIELNLSLS